LLFEIDPTKLETALSLAKVDLQEALADVAEAESTLELTLLEIDSARTQLELRRSAMARQQDLQKRGLTSSADVDAAILAFSVAEQMLIGRTQLKAQNEAKLEQSKITVQRRQISLDEAERTLNDARFFAPFDGVLANVTGVLGGTVSVNEKLADLIDPHALEIPVRVTNTQFSRLLNDQGNLRKIELTASLQTGRQRFDFTAKLDRVSAEVGQGQVGRLVYARINASQPNLVMPGDFVSLSIPERQLQDVFLLPASAVTADGRVLLLGEDNRLTDQVVNVVRLQGDQVVVQGLAAGSQYVVARAPELGNGVTVEPIIASDSALSIPASDKPSEPDTIALDDERRAKLIEFVQGNEGMQASSKERVLAELAKPEVSREIVDKFEAKMAGQ
jgi:RND family efflux transporter MFP subunit